MTSGWEKISNDNKREENKITITKNYGFGFTDKMYRDNNIKEFKYVQLYYNATENSIGLHFTNSGTKNDAFWIIHRPNKKGASIKARNLFKKKNIDVEKYRGHYDYDKQTVAGIGELYVIKLKERQV